MTTLQNIKNSIEKWFGWIGQSEQQINKKQKIEKVGDQNHGKNIQLKQKDASESGNSNKQKPQTPGNQQNDHKNSSIMKNFKKMIWQQQQQCPICLKSVKKSSMINLCQCQHIFCTICLKQYIKNQISTFTQIKCLQQTCESTLLNKQTQFYKFLPNKTKTQIERISKYKIISNDPYLKLCPNQNCQGLIPLIKKSPLICNQCHSQFCKKCMYFKHEGKCSKNQILFLSQKYRFRRCSKCGIIVEKIEACNHITCKCGYEFCYGCGKKWSSAHACPRPLLGRSNGQHTGNCDSCAVTNDSLALKTFKFLGKLFLTTFCLIAVSSYVCICLIPLMLIILIIGIMAGICLYSILQVQQACDKNGIGIGILLIFLFPIALALGVISAFKGFWGQTFIFWGEILVQAYRKPIIQIWQ